MSRQSQDIPIRPRYGIPAGSEDLASGERPRQRSSSNSAQMTTSSYSEIPFLAQYDGDVPPGVEETPSDESENNVKKSSEGGGHEQQEDYDGNGEDDDDDDDDDDDNSKDSSNEVDGGKNQNQPYDASIPYELEGTTSNNGEMRHFAAENTRKDQQSSTSHDSTPSTSTTASPLTRHFMQEPLPQIDANAISDIELEAQYLAQSVDNLLENLTNLLHSISSITADNVEVHRCAVNKLTDTMDANIKCMYTIMAKTEEITKAMKPTEKLGQRIREIKRLVDLLEATA